MQSNNFPILIQLQEDAKVNGTSFRCNDRLVIDHPENIPSGVSFLICETQYPLKIARYFEQEVESHPS